VIGDLVAGIVTGPRARPVLTWRKPHARQSEVVLQMTAPMRLLGATASLLSTFWRRPWVCRVGLAAYRPS